MTTQSDDHIRVSVFPRTGRFDQFTKEDFEQSIPERFEKIARMYPERVAVKMGERALSYSELNQAANRVAHAILEKRGSTSEPVALLFEHGTDVVAAILGVLKAGKIYVALDPWFPIERNHFLLVNSQARMIITNRHYVELSGKLNGDAQATVNTDEIDGASSTNDPGVAISPDRTMHLLYTSGSTGEPKGVAHSHRSYLLRAMANAVETQVTPDDRLSLLHGVSSGSSRLHLFLSLLNGSLLDLFDIKAQGAHHLLRWLKEELITICHLPPAVFRQLADVGLDSAAPPSLRLISLSGAPITRDDFEIYKSTFSKSAVLRIYMGTSETVEVCSCVVRPDFKYPTNGAPIGYAAPGKKVLLLNDTGNEVKPGEIGEIAVKSRYNAEGYWRKPDLTAAKFLPDPEGGDERIYLTGDLGRMLPDGFLLHLGRKDLMVNIRAYSVEVGEVEAAILRLDSVKAAVVQGHPDGEGNQRLVAYVVPATGKAPTQSGIRRALERLLPDYMIPSAVILLEMLPLLPNGKVDRRALPDPGKSRPELTTAYVAPKTALEEQLVQIWGEVLGLDQIGVHDNFVDLGGHSLAAARLISRVIKTFRLELPVTALFDLPTVAEMTKFITAHQGKTLDQTDLENILNDLESVSDEQAKLLVSEARSVESKR